MFAKYIQSVLWTDTRAPGDERRDFKAIYIFDDGFGTKKDAAKKVCRLGFSPALFLYLRFCRGWYAVSFNSYFSSIVVTKEGTWAATEKYQERPVKYDDEDAERILDPDLRPDRKKWQDGICRDLLLADPGLELIDVNGTKVPEGAVMWNNALISFGVKFFRTEICIRTQDYISHVFSAYYSDRSMQKMYERCAEAKSKGYEYLNPFTGDVSRNKGQSMRKLNRLLKECGLEKPEPIMRPLNQDGFRVLTQRERHPAKPVQGDPKYARYLYGKREYEKNRKVVVFDPDRKRKKR